MSITQLPAAAMRAGAILPSSPLRKSASSADRDGAAAGEIPCPGCAIQPASPEAATSKL